MSPNAPANTRTRAAQVSATLWARVLAKKNFKIEDTGVNLIGVHPIAKFLQTAEE